MDGLGAIGELEARMVPILGQVAVLEVVVPTMELAPATSLGSSRNCASAVAVLGHRIYRLKS